MNLMKTHTCYISQNLWIKKSYKTTCKSISKFSRFLTFPDSKSNLNKKNKEENETACHSIECFVASLPLQCNTLLKPGRKSPGWNSGCHFGSLKVVNSEFVIENQKWKRFSYIFQQSSGIQSEIDWRQKKLKKQKVWFNPNENPEIGWIL